MCIYIHIIYLSPQDTKSLRIRQVRLCQAERLERQQEEKRRTLRRQRQALREQVRHVAARRSRRNAGGGKSDGVGIFWGHWRDFCDISMIFLCFIEKVNLITRSPLVSVENIPREWGKCG